MSPHVCASRRTKDLSKFCCGHESCHTQRSDTQKIRTLSDSARFVLCAQLCRQTCDQCYRLKAGTAHQSAGCEAPLRVVNPAAEIVLGGLRESTSVDVMVLSSSLASWTMHERLPSKTNVTSSFANSVVPASGIREMVQAASQ